MPSIHFVHVLCRLGSLGHLWWSFRRGHGEPYICHWGSFRRYDRWSGLRPFLWPTFVYFRPHGAYSGLRSNRLRNVQIFWVGIFAAPILHWYLGWIDFARLGCHGCFVSGLLHHQVHGGKLCLSHRGGLHHQCNAKSVWSKERVSIDAWRLFLLPCKCYRDWVLWNYNRLFGPEWDIQLQQVQMPGSYLNPY